MDLFSKTSTSSSTNTKNSNFLKIKRCWFCEKTCNTRVQICQDCFVNKRKNKQNKKDI